MGQDKKNLGYRGEQIASEYLASKGYQIIQRNFRAKQYGEIDIIAQKGDLLIFVEVKTRVGDKFGTPEEAITSRKLHELKKMVDYYFNLQPKLALSPQIDVIAVTLDVDNTLSGLKHFENVTL